MFFIEVVGAGGELAYARATTARLHCVSVKPLCGVAACALCGLITDVPAGTRTRRRLGAEADTQRHPWLARTKFMGTDETALTTCVTASLNSAVKPAARGYEAQTAVLATTKRSRKR
jgi:hypothetical protein